MIVTTQKPLDEVLEYISPYQNILITGCDGCTQPPRGIKEAEVLAQLLELATKAKNKKFNFQTMTIAKQCDDHVVSSVLESKTKGVDAILSLACGIGVQTLAQLYPTLPVFPAQNTHFMGAEERDQATLEVMCAGCGHCILVHTGGICPYARCSKGLSNGVCGGSKNGKCEISPERDCAWVLIYSRLKQNGQLDILKTYHEPRDYQLTGWKVST
jgi:hypothetical protein